MTYFKEIFRVTYNKWRLDVFALIKGQDLDGSLAAH